MMMLAGFGRLLLSVKKKLMRPVNNLGRMDTGWDNTNKPKTLLWDVVDGPFHRQEFSEEDLQNVDIDDDDLCCLIVKVEEDNKVGLINLWFKSEDEAIKIVDYFKHNIEPLEFTDD